MTHTYSAGGSRRAAVFTAIIGLHFALYLVVASIQVPDPREKTREPGPITVQLPMAQIPVFLPPEVPGRIEPGDYFWPKPVIVIPTFDSPQSAPTAPTVGGEYQDGLSPQRAPVERVAASLQGRGSGFADVVRTCYPASARRAGEEGRLLIAVTIGSQGPIRSWRVVQSSGFPRLDAAAPCVLERLNFNAAREDGRAVQSEVLLPIVFRLD